MGNLISGEVIFKEKAVITLENCRKAYGWNCSLCTGLACKVSAYHPWPSGLGVSSKPAKLMAIYSLLIPGLDQRLFFMCTLQNWREIKNMWEISQALRKYLQNTVQLWAHAHSLSLSQPTWKEEEKNHHEMSTANIEFDAHRVLHPGELHLFCRVGLVNAHIRKLSDLLKSDGR